MNKLDQLREMKEKLAQGGGEKRIKAQHDKGKTDCQRETCHPFRRRQLR